MPNIAKPLTVYKASAGSGKTFTLAVEYIKLVVANPQAYRQTLAVTFTNKATEEMKMRILSQLYGIWRQLDDSRHYINKVCEGLGITPEAASERAGMALRLLLHNYSYFRVETIDSFFQSMLRNLARELELTANLRVGLNDNEVEEQAVDQLIDSLQATDLMLQWLLRYIMDNINDDRSWNVIGQIKQFGKTIFRDYYKQESQKLNEVIGQKDFMDHYAATLREERAKARERIQQIAETFFDILEREGLSVDDFSGKSRGVCGIFLKMQRGVFDESIITKTVADTLGNPSKWVTKTHQRAQFLQALAEAELDPILHYAVEEQPRQWRRFKSADLTLRHLSQLRLLGTIESKVRQLNEDQNRFLLSDTQQLLHDLIDGSDSPFIFEKIGTQLEHIMIDEFQDTSTVQWKNFKVLLREAMSHQGSSSLIVGDVKQSIYRWRSGDWRLLADIEREFADNGTQVEVKVLDTNYRSQTGVIRFNNAFFAEAARQEEVTAYGDVEQKWPAGRTEEGLVSIRLLPSADYQQTTLETIANQVSDLLETGVKADRIAILVRANNYIPLIANYLQEHLPEVRVVSDEAFRLDASPAVQMIVHALHLLYHPDDNIARAFLAKACTGRLDGPLPEAYADHREELLRLPLYELTEQLLTIFDESLGSSQSAYLCAFFDHVATFAAEGSNDGHAFLREWEEHLRSKTIQSPETNGLRIISIHKSKGLEFDNVIIPFCDWRMEHSDILWCHPKEAPFNALPLVPIDYSQKGMKGTVYEADYDEEHQQVTVDNLNLLYVAFTRASRSLFVIGKRGSRSSRSAIIEQVLPQLQLPGATLTGEMDTDAPLTFTYGSIGHSQFTIDNPPLTSHNPFLQESTPIAVNIVAHSQSVAFKQSNQSLRFATAEEDEIQTRRDSYIQLGSVLHEVFATIGTTTDIDKALKRLEVEGIIYDQHITRSRLEDLIRQRLASPRVAEWFAPHWRLYRECTILLPDGREQRPDRVITDGRQTIVIDFKFGRERDEYHTQVREYMLLLNQMGLPHVQGFLWFVYSNQVVEVRLTNDK